MGRWFGGEKGDVNKRYVPIVGLSLWLSAQAVGRLAGLTVVSGADCDVDVSSSIGLRLKNWNDVGSARRAGNILSSLETIVWTKDNLGF